jgi:hypothetical protein
MTKRNEFVLLALALVELAAMSMALGLLRRILVFDTTSEKNERNL